MRRETTAVAGATAASHAQAAASSPTCSSSVPCCADKPPRPAAAVQPLPPLRGADARWPPAVRRLLPLQQRQPEGCGGQSLGLLGSAGACVAFLRSWVLPKVHPALGVGPWSSCIACSAVAEWPDTPPYMARPPLTQTHRSSATGEARLLCCHPDVPGPLSSTGSHVPPVAQGHHSVRL